MGRKKIRQQLLFWNYQNRKWSQKATRLCHSLEEVKKVLNSKP